MNLEIHIYTLLPSEPELLISPFEHEAKSQPEAMARVMNLPCQALSDCWRNLHFDPDIKQQLLRFVTSMSMKQVLLHSSVDCEN